MPRAARVQPAVDPGGPPASPPAAVTIEVSVTVEKLIEAVALLSPEQWDRVVAARRAVEEKAAAEQAAAAKAAAERAAAAKPAAEQAAAAKAVAEPTAPAALAPTPAAAGSLPPEVYDEVEPLFTHRVVGIDANADIRLLTSGYVIELWKSSGRFAKRQDLPEKAFLPRPSRHVVAISYGWLEKGDPDPDGWHLGILGPLLDLFVRNLIQVGQAATADDVGFFIDFCCLWQAPREGARKASFDRGLRLTNYVYANRFVFVWAQTKMPPGIARDYWSRGWTYFELVVGSLVKMHVGLSAYTPSEWEVKQDDSYTRKAFMDARLLDLAKLEPSEEDVRMGRRGANSAIKVAELPRFHEVARVCSGGVRKPPLAPAAFTAELERRQFTNGRTDHDAVLELYQRTLDEVLASVTELQFVEAGWQDAQFQQLAEVLPRATRLRTLQLYNNGYVTDKGAAALVASLPASVTNLDMDRTRATFVVPGKEKGKKGAPNRHPRTREEVDACRRFYEAWRASQ